MSVESFYDRLAPYYHLLYADWSDSVRRQGQELAAVINERWPHARGVLDLACGIGTQSLGLAHEGFAVTASDLSAESVRRAAVEARWRRLEVAFSIADMRAAFAGHGDGFDVVVACDDAIRHLPEEQHVLTALREMLRCLTPGGGCLLSVREGDKGIPGLSTVEAFGVREEAGIRYLLLQVRTPGEKHDDLDIYLTADHGDEECGTQIMRTSRSTISEQRIMALMRDAGFTGVTRVEGRFFQPLLIGSRPA